MAKNYRNLQRLKQFRVLWINFDQETIAYSNQRFQNFRCDFLTPSHTKPIFGNRCWYTEHALERIAPKTPEVMRMLKERFYERSQKMLKDLSYDKYSEWVYQNYPKPRGVPPMVIEAKIRQPGITNVTVILNERGDVITLFPQTCL